MEIIINDQRRFFDIEICDVSQFRLDQFKRAMFGSKREPFISLEIPGQFLLPLDVNEQEILEAVEVVVRPLALGRKNYLFAGSHDAAKDIAMYYSFMATCKKKNINRQDWLQYVLKNINVTKISDLKNLLPQFINPELLGES